MNYGRFFRLNKNLSKLGAGVVIYDYIELPAYPGSSEKNNMSPKYPVSMTITPNSVRFRLHYSVYKKETLGYGYSVEDFEGRDSMGDLKMAHMEEVIFDLPYMNDATERLANTIKDLYKTKFPQKIDNNTSSGGRYLEEIIRRRFPGENNKTSQTKEDISLEDEYYESMQGSLDSLPSYSSLWLMGLVKGEGKDTYVNLYEDNSVSGAVVGFLRKLLLDFMFDLRHSDLFQNSKYYDQMYSGLMSDFYFSAIMHKCEFYYYRELIMDKIKEHTNDEKKQKETERIIQLYTSNLCHAEELWTQDIMDLRAEKLFGYNQSKNPSNLGNEPKKGKSENPESASGKDKPFCEKITGIFKTKLFAVYEWLIKYHWIEDNEFTNRNSWFAEPEEEMRRIYFPMDEYKTEEKKDKIEHLCNTAILMNYFESLKNTDSDKKDINSIQKQEIIDFTEKNKESVSKWFLARYDFNDVCHLHLTRWANLVIFAIQLLSLLAIFFLPVSFFEACIQCIDNTPCLPTVILVILLTIVGLVFYKFRSKKKKFYNLLLCTHKSKNTKNVISFFFILSLMVVIITYGWPFVYFLWDLITNYIGAGWASIVLSICLIVGMCKGRQLTKPMISCLHINLPSFKHITAYLHLFLPRLVATITTAWLTMSMGFDLYVAFYDKHVSWAMVIMILIIVFAFVLYELNCITPESETSRKLFRCVQLVTISYCISLVVGSVVINFVGQSYMDRGGAFDDDKVQNFTVAHTFTINKIPSEDLEIKQLMQKEHCEKGCQSIMIFQFGGHEVFFMRDFLIMFSFVTMFMGIFLQMFIFENKKMTEL